MTQDQPQTPEPNQPQPTESPIEPALDSTDNAELSDVKLTDNTSETDVPLTDATLSNLPSEESQLKSTDFRSETSLESGKNAGENLADDSVDSAIEQTVVEPPAQSSVKDTPSENLVVNKAQSQAEADSAPARSSSAPAPAPNKAASFLRLVGQLWGIVLPILVIVLRWAWQVILVTLKWTREAWKVILPKIRAILPAGWRKLPDWALTTVAVGLLIFVFWLTAQLFLPGKAPATAIDRPSPTINAPAPQQPAEPVPDPDLIANIQTQVAEVTDAYAEGLIQAVQANFRDNLLTVKVGDEWSTLGSETQSRLANELLKRSHKLDFDNLEITNAEGERLARSPVVGSKMLIYERLAESKLSNSQIEQVLN